MSIRPFLRSAQAGLLSFLVMSGVAGAADVQPGAAQLVPYRAIYKLTLASTRSNSKVADLSGHMFYEWKDACDGWTLAQRFQLHFQYTQGDELDSTTNYLTWEAKDGLSYRYNVRKIVGGAPDEERRGEASLSKAGGEGMAHDQLPKVQDEKLAAGTLFPTAHTLQLLAHAAAGDLFLNRKVFDGTDDDEISEINAYIGAKSEASAPADVDKDGLIEGPAWKIRMAFFPLTSTLEAPDYEMSTVMLQNGIAQSMQIDYGDFTVDGTLEKIEKITDPSGC